MDELAALVEGCWERLAAACRSRGSPLRTPALATTSEAGCEVRTVVLRSVDPAARALVCYADGRSGKIVEIDRDPRAVWLFCEPYAGGRAVQYRMSGASTVHRGDARAAQAWASVPAERRRDYAERVAPGRVLGSKRTSGALAPQENFALVRTVVVGLDLLELAPSGNRRARCVWTGGDWESHWIAP